MAPYLEMKQATVQEQDWKSRSRSTATATSARRRENSTSSYVSSWIVRIPLLMLPLPSLIFGIIGYHPRLLSIAMGFGQHAQTPATASPPLNFSRFTSLLHASFTSRSIGHANYSWARAQGPRTTRSVKHYTAWHSRSARQIFRQHNPTACDCGTMKWDSPTESTRHCRS